MTIIALEQCKETEFTFSDDFNECIDYANLPGQLEKLTFGSQFNWDFGGIEWDRLTHLTFGKNFNENMSEIRFLNLIMLKFGEAFNRDIYDAIMPNLTHLIFGDNFCKRITNHENYWPKLSVVCFCGYFDRDIMNNRFKLPPSITNLRLGDIFDDNIDDIGHKFPALQTLIFGDLFNQEMTNVYLPPTLSSLQFDGDYDQNIDIELNSLQVLQFGGQFNQPINASWPELISLIFGDRFDQDLSNLKSPKLNNLTLGEKFNKPHTIMFENLHYIYDYSCTVTENTYKIPRTLHEIIHILSYKLKAYEQMPIIKTTIYKRFVGQLTKATINSCY
jgi:hypothetical protein